VQIHPGRLLGTELPSTALSLQGGPDEPNQRAQELHLDAAENLLRASGEESPDRAFFDHWFKRKYFFLFKKNLDVTNVQFAELFALIRTHLALADDPSGKVGRDVHLLTRSDYRRFLYDVLRDITRSSSPTDATDLAVTTFGEIFERTLLIAPPHTRHQPLTPLSPSGQEGCGLS
jgi:hypothetical protein